MVLKQLGARPDLSHCHATQKLDALMASAVTPVGVGGAEVVQKYEFINNCYTKGYITNAYLLLVEKLLSGHLFYHLDHL